MGHGLVPILSAEANIDTVKCGVLLQDCQIDTIRSAITRASKLGTIDIRTMAMEGIGVTKSFYTVEKFRSDIREAIVSIVGLSQ
jgi:hypothetical protein